MRRTYIKKYPQLLEVDTNVELNDKIIPEWLNSQIEKYGEYLDIEPMNNDEVKNTLKDLNIV